MDAVVCHLRRAALLQAGGCLTDGQLLERFLAGRDEDAFAALMQRHGGLVWGVCRHLLRQEQDAEDAFQATFLVLARKASSIRKGEALARGAAEARLTREARLALERLGRRPAVSP